MAITTNADVARRVRGLAAENRVTQADMAAALNVSRMSMWRRVNGDTPFTAEELIKLSALFGAPVGSFFGEVTAAGVA